MKFIIQEKKDVSGTAIKLGEILLKHYSKLSGLSFNADNAIFPKKLNDNLLNCILNIDLKTDDMVTMANQVTSAIKDFKIPIVSIRYGDVVGIHKVQFIGINDYVEFSHAVKDRTVFAEGAVKAAYWLRTRQAGVYSIDDMIKY